MVFFLLTPEAMAARWVEFFSEELAGVPASFPLLQRSLLQLAEELTLLPPLFFPLLMNC